MLLDKNSIAIMHHHHRLFSKSPMFEGK